MPALLEQITHPERLRELPEQDLPLLAGEVRQFTIDTVAKTGGHLGASLGVVELTIALPTYPSPITPTRGAVALKRAFFESCGQYLF